MKVKELFGLFILAMLPNACANDETTSDVKDTVKSINVAIENAGFYPANRSAYVVDPSLGFVSSWSEGDIIGIYPLGGDQVAFPISEGTGSNNARFDGGKWALRANKQYSAYYPFRKENYTVSETEIPVTYTGQVQNGNNSTVGLAAFDYLASAATQPYEDGSVDLTMKHLGAFIRFRITIPSAATLVRAYVESDKTKFVTQGTVDLSSNEPSITPTTTSSNFCVSLSNITCAENEVVTFYAMVAPADLSTSKITITLIDNEGKRFLYESEGYNFVAGKAYDCAITEVTTSGTTRGHDWVDLGLPSGTLWASYNVGGTKPEDYGNYYAWGEVNTKVNYTVSNYTHFSKKSSSNPTYTAYYSHYINKYNTQSIWGDIDNKTILDPEDDVATVRWGEEWCMPTYEQLIELVDLCSWTWTTKNDVTGYEVTGINNKTLFFPAAGYITSTSGAQGSHGVYWTRSLATDVPEGGSDVAHFLRLDVNDGVEYGYFLREQGFTVRPVRNIILK